MSSLQHQIGFNEKNPVFFTLSEFNGREYLHLREYYLDFEGDYKPTNKGVSVEYDINSARELFRAFSHILAKTEFLDILIEEHYGKDSTEFVARSL